MQVLPYASFLDSVSNAAKGAGDAVVNGAKWCGRTIASAGQAIYDLILRMIEAAKPYFSNAANFVAENRVPAMALAGGIAIGAALYALIQYCMKPAAQAPAAQAQAAPVAGGAQAAPQVAVNVQAAPQAVGG